jgi:hypothetical protein
MRITIGILLLILLALPGGSPVSADTPFSDVSDHWAESSIMTLFRQKILMGFPDGSFRPDDAVEESQLCKILVLAHSAGAELSPVSSGANWAMPYFLFAKEEGWLPWDHFEPSRQVPRGAAAFAFWRAFYPQIEVESMPSFLDVPDGSTFFVAIEGMHQLGILQGFSVEEFLPESSLTRAELAVILCRILGKDQRVVEELTTYGPIRLSCRPSQAFPGFYLEVQAVAPPAFRVELFWGEEVIAYSVPCLIPIPLGQEPYVATIRFHVQYREIDKTLTLAIPISYAALPTETIDLSPAAQDLLSGQFLQREREILYAVLDQPSSQPPILAWNLPVLNPVISAFGTERDYGELGFDYHYGVDFSGEEGDPVRATASGIVVLAEELYSRGNTLVLAHGGGLFSLYYHLSVFLVQVGDPVSQGQSVGRVGQTGAVTGPHLHWEARIGRIPVNPLQFLAENQR